MRLNVWGRIVLTQIIGAVEGNAATTRMAYNLLNKLEMTADEVKEVGLTAMPNGTLIWDDKEREWEFEFDKNATDLLVRTVQNWSHWTAAQTPMRVDLFKRIGIPESDE